MYKLKYLLLVVFYTFPFVAFPSDDDGPWGPPNEPAAAIDNNLYVVICAVAIVLFVFFYLKAQKNKYILSNVENL